MHTTADLQSCRPTIRHERILHSRCHHKRRSSGTPTSLDQTSPTARIKHSAIHPLLYTASTRFVAPTRQTAITERKARRDGRWTSFAKMGHRYEVCACRRRERERGEPRPDVSMSSSIFHCKVGRLNDAMHTVSGPLVAVRTHFEEPLGMSRRARPDRVLSPVLLRGVSTDDVNHNGRPDHSERRQCRTRR
ncbi:hypothetical protein OH77DRAFT_1426457 [Trametes cingulata]|nr:hypothetical protein OH77DRAFT_1426457 [Trametes cingulata]